MIQIIPEAEIAKFEEIYSNGQKWEAINPTERLRPLKPGSARHLWSLTILLNLKTGLEIGTSAGYSTMWLADAFRRNGGSLTSVEMSPQKSEMARRNLQDVSLEPVVTLIVGRGEDFLKESTQKYDLVFLDSSKEMYAKLFHLAWPKLMVGGLLVADNVISHRHLIGEFFSLVENTCPKETCIVDVGDGLLITRRREPNAEQRSIG